MLLKRNEKSTVIKIAISYLAQEEEVNKEGAGDHGRGSK
jgi:hypothetical protein